jgi:carboxymethylenebutenolidase
MRRIEDVARRLAMADFVAFAPDALAPLGGYPGDDEKAAQLFGKVVPAKRSEDLLAAYDALKARPECAGKVAGIGFCFGGTTANMFAVRLPDLAAAVPFYGGQPRAADAARIRAPLMLHYAGLDERVNAGWPAYEAALKANGVKYQMFMYPNVNHGFHNDSRRIAMKPRRSSRGLARWRFSTKRRVDSALRRLHCDARPIGACSCRHTPPPAE